MVCTASSNKTLLEIQVISVTKMFLVDQTSIVDLCSCNLQCTLSSFYFIKLIKLFQPFSQKGKNRVVCIENGCLDSKQRFVLL